MNRPISDPERPYLDSSGAGWTCSKCGRDSADGWSHTCYCPVAVQDRTTRNDWELLVTHSPWPCKVRLNSLSSGVECLWPVIASQRRCWDPVVRTIFQSLVEWTEDVPPGVTTHPRKKHL